MNKHLLSGVALSAMLLAAASASAQTVIYSNDYESQTVGDYSSDTSWKGKYWTDNQKSAITRFSIEEDATHGKVVVIKPRSGNKGTGGGLFRFRDANSDTSTKDPLSMETNNIQQYTVELDMALNVTAAIINKGGNLTLRGANSQIALMNSTVAFPKRFDYGITYSTSSVDCSDNAWNNILLFQSLSSDEQDISAVTEEVADYKGADLSFKDMDTEGEPSFSFPVNGTWCHFKVDVDRAKKTVAWSITPEGGTAVTGSLPGSLANDLILNSIYFRASSGDSDRDYVKIDNVKVTSNSTDGIAEIGQETKADNAYYTLSGVKTSKPQHGVYIHNGRKVVIK